ncbi:hypothetical protein CRE_05236 [Caenorhabditis remanei]|uniref:Uncharacterized protein n=1 Tax=Caenorhabditis remanei TaxID=31234 RepID=E3NGU4_CAERE|nr:hypothetical protein CRE_05236 [Caenorhabditis remanei]
MKCSVLVVAFLLVTVSTVIIRQVDGQRRLPSVGGNSYYEWLMRAQHGGLGSQNPIVSSRSPKLDRNCFFSPVQCMFDTSSTDNLNSFRR